MKPSSTCILECDTELVSSFWSLKALFRWLRIQILYKSMLPPNPLNHLSNISIFGKPPPKKSAYIILEPFLMWCHGWVSSHEHVGEVISVSRTEIVKFARIQKNECIVLQQIHGNFSPHNGLDRWRFFPAKNLQYAQEGIEFDSLNICLTVPCIVISVIIRWNWYSEITDYLDILEMFSVRPYPHIHNLFRK